MSMLSRHARALQASGAAVLVTAALVALPLMAAEQFNDAYYADQVVRMFQKLGAENASVYSNASLETSAFDFSMYFSHTCYRATDYDMARCKEAFGPYADLHETYTSGKLAAIFNGYAYLKGISPLLPGGVKVEETTTTETPAVTTPETTPDTVVVPSTDSTQAVFEFTTETRVERGQKVWHICLKRLGERGLAAGCYQKNIRLIMERTEAITEDIVQ